MKMEMLKQVERCFIKLLSEELKIVVHSIERELEYPLNVTFLTELMSENIYIYIWLEKACKKKNPMLQENMKKKQKNKRNKFTGTSSVKHCNCFKLVSQRKLKLIRNTNDIQPEINQGVLLKQQSHWNPKIKLTSHKEVT